MDKKSSDAVREILSLLRQKKISGIDAFMGFDACIDNIVRIVKDKKDNITEFYLNSRQFGEFLISRESKSCGIQLHTQHSKLGGNMVIMSNAIGKLGIKTDCIGTFGLPDILPVFRSMSSYCTLYSVGEPIATTALEFNDAKVMMFDLGPYSKLDWSGIKDILGIDRIRQLFSGKQLVSFLNWSEIENSSNIWKGIIEEILPSASPSKTHRFFFADFSDCTRRSKEEIRYAIGLLAFFRKYFRVIFSMNQNEAEIIANALDMNAYSSDEDLINMLFITCKVDEILIHRTKDAIAFDGITYEKCATFFCEDPTILTGGGDNFNAGFCFSRFYTFNLFQSLLVANAVSGYYVKTGTSPDVYNLIDFLENKLSE